MSFHLSFAQRIDIHRIISPCFPLALAHLDLLLRAALGQQPIEQVLEALILVGEHDSSLQALWHQSENGCHETVI